MKGFTAIVQLYLDKGADLNEETESKDTALSLATWQNHTDVRMTSNSEIMKSSLLSVADVSVANEARSRYCSHRLGQAEYSM
jgi:hypothetical protein